MIRLLKYLKPYMGMVIGVIIFTFLNVITQLYIPNLMGDIVDKGVLKGDFSYILSTGGRMLIVALLGSIAMVIATYLSSKVAMSYGRDLRSDVFRKVENFSLSEMNNLGTSSLITRTTNDINQLQQVVAMALRMMVRAPIMLIGGIIMAVNKNVQLSKVFIVAAPVLVISIGIVGSIGFPFFKIIQKKVDNLNQVLREELTGIRVIRAFNKEGYEEKRFDDVNYDLTTTMLQVTRLMAIMRPLLNLILDFTSVAVIWFGSKLIGTGNLEVGELMTFLQYVMQIMFSLVMVSVMIIMIPRASASAVRVNEVLDTINPIKNPTNPVNAENLNGRLEFKDVSFKYKGAENPVLCNLDFLAEPGKITAIIGGTGAGKSTLLNLIPRFYDTTEGEVLLDGVNIKDIDQDILRDKIGLVPQKADLFSGTIIDNVRFGKEDASFEEVKHAVDIAQGRDFVESLEGGYDSEVAQGGTNFSGGQKQRLSIARALVKKPEIYIFDDSFSALDFKTDKKLREALRREVSDKTMIIVAQRVSTILDADNIIVLENGMIAGQGTHEELLKNNEIYKEIVLSQFSEEAI